MPRKGVGSVRARLELSILFLGVLLLGLAPYPRAYATTMRQAEAHRAAQEYGAALLAYEQATRLDPRSPLARLQMGQIYLQQQRFWEAEIALLEAVRGDTGIDALLGLGESRAARGDWAQALNAWLQAQAVDPDDARVYLALSRGALAQNQFDLAIRRLQQALELDPSPVDARASHALLGRLMLEQDPEKAAAHLVKAGDEDMLSVLAAARAESDAAERALFLGTAFLQRGELPLSRTCFERAVAADPDNTRAHTYLGHVLDQAGETVAAREHLERALVLDADNALAHYFLGVHERTVGNLEKAQAAFWQALHLDPENAAFRADMGATFLALGDYGSAEEWYVAAADVAPSDLDFQLMLVHFYLDHLYRTKERGVLAAKATVALAPDDARALDLLGWAYYLSGNPAEADQSLFEALALDPGLASAHFHLGSLYAGTGRVALARDHLQRAADLDTGGYFRRRAEAMLQDLE